MSDNPATESDPRPLREVLLDMERRILARIEKMAHDLCNPGKPASEAIQSGTIKTGELALLFSIRPAKVSLFAKRHRIRLVGHGIYSRADAMRHLTGAETNPESQAMPDRKRRQTAAYRSLDRAAVKIMREAQADPFPGVTAGAETQQDGK